MVHNSREDKAVVDAIATRFEEKDAENENPLEDEKSSSALDLTNGDEALGLVGATRMAEFSEEYNRKLRWKLDLLIPPLCSAVYFTQFLDKTSLNYASIMDFPITGQQYNLVSLAFYAGFLVFEFPTVYLSQKSGYVAKYLGANIVLWGTVLMLHAATTSFGSFFALRFILGMCESCVAPSLILVISMFYKKNEQASRISWFYTMNGMAQIFGGFIAYGVSFDDGHLLPPYKIIYILLGALAILVGISVLIWLPDSPVRARSSFLSNEEKVAALERVRDDGVGTENTKLKWYQVREALMDVRTWLVVLTALLTSVPIGALSTFSNIIIRSFGYTSTQTLILSTPAGAVQVATALICGWYSDKKGERMMPIVYCVVPTIVGFAMMIGLNGKSKGALLFAVYLTGTFGIALSMVYAYNASNTSGHTKKSTINSMTLVAFGIGNIIGTEVFQPKDAPGYIPGKIVIMVFLIVEIFLSFLLRYFNIKLNKEKRAKITALMQSHGWTEADIQRERERHAFLDLTDKENVYFVYTS